MKRKTEEALQARIVREFTNKYCLKHHKPRLIIHSTPNGGTRNVLEAAKLKSSGLLSGVADITIKLPNSVFIDIELKNGKKGYLSKNQKEMQKRLHDLNCNYFVIRDIDEFRYFIYPLVDKHIKNYYI